MHPYLTKQKKCDNCPEGQGTPLFGLNRCATEQGMVFRVLHLRHLINSIYNFTIQHLEQGIFLDWKHEKSMTVDQQSANNFFQKTWFHDVSLKNHLPCM